MNKTIYRQYDSRWGSKPYPKGSTMSGCGCGVCACTHVAIEQERYKNWTPENLRSWMISKGFAIRGQGTLWEGITQTLKHIGHGTVVRIYSDPMSEAWKELNKGNRIGVLLFGSGKAPDGTVWTTGGHYVAFTDYKVSNGKHWFYCKDSGSRQHDGWMCYETSMKGRLPKLWIVQRVGAQVESAKATCYTPSTPYTGSLPTKTVKNGTKGSDAKAVQTFLNWCINAKLAVDGIAGAKTEYAIEVFQKTYGLTADGIFGPATKSKAQSIVNQHKPNKSNAQKIADKAAELAYSGNPSEAKYPSGKPTAAYKEALNKVYPDRSKWGKAARLGASCDVFVGTCVRASGTDPSFPRGLSEQLPHMIKSDKFTEITYKKENLRAGDIVIYKRKNAGQHIFIVKNSKLHICEANHESTYGITRTTTNAINYKLKTSNKSWIRIFRAR